jgi:hypothetical protein
MPNKTHFMDCSFGEEEHKATILMEEFEAEK